VGKDDDEIEIVEVEGCPEWMLTMGDCMSLLLCFFVMMLAFSTPDEEKLMNVIAGMQGALGIIPPIMREKGVSVYKVSKDSKDDKVADGSPEKVEFDVKSISPVDLRSMAIINRFNSFKNRLVELGFKHHLELEQVAEGIRMTIDFDKILVDAPCSSTGTIRKSLKTLRIWNPNMVKRLSITQLQTFSTLPQSTTRTAYTLSLRMFQ
jgi:flagellar motor protein MotB